jgi:prepilin-type N-terminal cleavage/methylation domain-containing protein
MQARSARSATGERRSAAGFTLIELMSAIALLSILTTAALSLAATLMASNARCARYAADIMACRRALRTFEQDARTARQAIAEPNAIYLTGPGGGVTYRLADGALTRSDNAHDVALARGVAAIDARCDGATIHFTMTLSPRRTNVRRSNAALSTAVRMRVAHSGYAAPRD